MDLPNDFEARRMDAREKVGNQTRVNEQDRLCSHPDLAGLVGPASGRYLGLVPKLFILFPA
jgi:hypothetical protein